MNPSQARAVERRARSIDGWFSREALMLFALLDECQADAGIGGNLFEIGAHHGRSAIMLDAMRRPGEALVVCDLFGEQGLNASASGHGDRAIFETNVPGATVIERSSLDLTPQDVGANLRFFHIDGGHLREEALSDLRLADRTVSDEGVVVIDDAFAFQFPGVTEAILDFLREGDMRPLVAGFNKLALTRRPDLYPLAGRLYEYVSAKLYTHKTVTLAGHEMVVVHPWWEYASPRAERWTAYAKWLRARGFASRKCRSGR